MSVIREYVRSVLIESAWDTYANIVTRIVFKKWLKRFQSKEFQIYGMRALDFRTKDHIDNYTYIVSNSSSREAGLSLDHPSCEGGVSTREHIVIVNIYHPVFQDFDGTWKVKSKPEDVYKALSSFIRHELEHVRQYENYIDKKFETTDHLPRDGKWVEYLTHPQEVEAFTAQAYYDAKKRRIKAFDTLYDKLESYKLNPENFRKVFKVWLDYAKTRFPKGQWE